jgi:hypothetical protein
MKNHSYLNARPTQASVWGVVMLTLTLAGCASKPPPPDWKLQSSNALQLSTAAYLRGQDRVAALELDVARKRLSSTGRADLLANAELVNCAAKTASLVAETCTGFEALRTDATPAQIAYAAYLRGQASAADHALLPPAQRTVAQAMTAEAVTVAVAAIEDPLSKLLAAAVALHTGKANPALLALAVDTASAQGWRRPLLAWLGVQAQQAEQSGASAEAATLRRRMALVGGTGVGAEPSR